MAFRMKGQGATEYLVLLAVILIIALVAISLLGFFPSMAADAKITQSSTYWRGEAAPISIQEHSFDGTTGDGHLVLLNNDALGAVSISSITLTDPSTEIPLTFNFTGSSVIVLQSGAQTTVPLAGGGLPTGMTSQDVYQYDVQIDYRSPDGLSKTESGAQPIIGKYST